MSQAFHTVHEQVYSMQLLLLLHAQKNGDKDCYAYRFGQIYIAEDSPDEHNKAMVNYYTD